jgi:hypothetical protein
MGWGFGIVLYLFFQPWASQRGVFRARVSGRVFIGWERGEEVARHPS